MTFSILAHDSESGAIGGAAATGSLCVGGWVLRGRLDAGMSASQGALPSTLWGEGVLSEMASGLDAASAVDKVTGADAGRAWRQLSALDLSRRGAAFTGTRNRPRMGSLAFDGGIVAGNMLGRVEVLDAMSDAFCSRSESFPTRLMESLRAAQAAGGDNRGLLSAALLVLHPERAPLTLRIDHHLDDPLSALEDLHDLATSGSYGEWTRQVPTRSHPERYHEH